MNTKAMEILRENVSRLRADRARWDTLCRTQITELIRLRDEEDPTALFRAVWGEECFTEPFARFCAEALGGVTDPEVIAGLFPEGTSALRASDNNRVAFLKNTYTDAALRTFSRRVTPMLAQAEPSFSAVCEAVSAEGCGRCILPIRTSEDGVLQSFLRLIDRHDLKISHTCKIPTANADGAIHFALLSRAARTDIPRDGFLQISVTSTDTLPLGRLLSLTETIGASPMRVSALPLSYREDRFSHTVCFRIGAGTAAPLLLFLRTVLGSYTLGGIFSEVPV